MDKKKIYMLCPRCELNYMLKGEKYCDVCKAELGLGDASFLLPDEDEEDVEGKLCPICHTNFCEDGEDMCIECKKELAAKSKKTEEENWSVEDEPVNEIDAEMDEVSLSVLEDEEDEEDDDDTSTEVMPTGDDDFDIGNPDDFEDDEDEESDKDKDDDF